MLISPLVAPLSLPSSLSNPGSYVGRGFLSICTMRLGGRCHDRIYHVDRADEFDVTHSGFFLHSSLAPVLRFRRSFDSVCNVLKGIKLHVLQRLGLLLCGIVGGRLFVWALPVLLPRLILGLIGFSLIFMRFTSGLWTL